MITIIHGNDVSSSRKYFSEQKEKVRNPIVLEGEKMSVSDLMQSDSGMLFGDSKKIFIEDFFAKKKRGKEYQVLIDYFNKLQKDNDIFFWEGKELSKKQTAVLSDSTIRIFKYPQAMFSFLEGLRPGNKSTISLFHKTLEQSEPELVFHMMVRQFRLLLAISSSHYEPCIDELNYMAPWQRSKLVKQATLFSQDNLIKLYKRLFEIDLAIKTGQSPLTLVQSIDFFLTDL